MKKSSTISLLMVALTLQMMALERHAGTQNPALKSHGRPVNARIQGILSEGYIPWVKQVSGLPAGRVVGSICAVDSNVVWAVSADPGVNAQIFTRTTDGGLKWACDTITGVPSTYCCLSVYAFDAMNAWVLMHNHSSVSGGGIAHTTDGGATWKLDSTAFQVPDGCADFIHFFDVNTGICVGDPTNGYFEIYRTTDAGMHWSRIPQASLPPPLPGEWGIYDVFTAAGSSLWFPSWRGPDSAGSRFFRTTDKGLTWSALQYPALPTGWWPVIEFQSETSGIGHGDLGDIRLTSDGGITWNRLPALPNVSLNHIKYVPQTTGMYVGSGFTQYADLVSGGQCGTFVTQDKGSTWTAVWATTDFQIPDMRFASGTVGWRQDWELPDVFKWSIGSGRLIGGLVDPLVFNTREKGTQSDTIGFDITNLGSDLLTISAVTSPKEAHFTLIDPPALPVSLATLRGLRLKVKFVPQDRGLFSDSLMITSNATNAPTLAVILGGSALRFDDAVRGPNMYAASDSMYTIAGNGTATLSGALNADKRAMNSLALNSVTKTLYGIYTAGTTSTLYRIDPFGPGLFGGAVVPVTGMRAIAFSPAGTLFGANVAGKLYRINVETGDSTLVGLPGIPIGSMAFGLSGKLYASLRTTTGDKDAIYTIDTSNGTATLIGKTGDGQITPSITFDANGNMYGLKGYGTVNTIIQINPATGVGTLVGSTGVSGLQSIVMLNSISTSVEDRKVAGVPQGFALEQNYPNPFNPVTIIYYSISGARSQGPGASKTRLVVYDLLGREVKVLVDEQKQPGNYEVRFDGTGLASGVYIYRLTAGSFVQSRKMVLLK